MVSGVIFTCTSRKLILSLVPNAELKQRVRNLERFYNRYLSAKTCILFNNNIYMITCIIIIVS